MKRIIVISDSHGNKTDINRIFDEFQFDYLIHLGDGIDDLGVYKYDERVKFVRGNCDFFSNEKLESFLVVENTTLFFTHGHEYGVKYTLNRLYDRIKDINVNLVLFGHTHKYSMTNINEITFLNPGSLSHSRNSNLSFCTIDIDGSNFSIEKHSF